MLLKSQGAFPCQVRRPSTGLTRTLTKSDMLVCLSTMMTTAGVLVSGRDLVLPRTTVFEEGISGVAVAKPISRAPA